MISISADLKRHLLGIDTQFLQDLMIKLENDSDNEFDYIEFLSMLDNYIESINSKFDVNEDM